MFGVVIGGQQGWQGRHRPARDILFLFRREGPGQASYAAAAPLLAGMQRPAGESGSKAMAEFEPVSYSYSQFYLVFALASCYIAMLMTGWGSGAEAKVRAPWGRGGDGDGRKNLCMLVCSWCLAHVWLLARSVPIIAPCLGWGRVCNLRAVLGMGGR